MASYTLLFELTCTPFTSTILHFYQQMEQAGNLCGQFSSGKNLKYSVWQTEYYMTVLPSCGEKLSSAA